MCYFVGYLIGCFGYYFYKPSKKNIVDQRQVFLEGALISKKVNRSMLNLDEIKESTITNLMLEQHLNMYVVKFCELSSL